MREHGSLSNNSSEEKLTIYIDPLTGLFNRYYLNNVLPQNLKDAEKNNLELTVFIIDIDDFKHINDTYGHLAGDDVLKGAAEIFKKSVRDDDVVIRYAGDEFIILSKEVGYKLASIIGERIVSGINNNIIESKNRKKIHVTISGGFAVYPHEGRRQEELIENADRALYLSKQKGKNRISAANEVNVGLVTNKEMLKIFPCRTFINREEQLDKLKKAWQNSTLGKTSLIFVKGEMGIGKTRILEEIDGYISKEEGFCLKVGCHAKYTGQPYYVLSQALEKYLERSEALSHAVYFLSPQEVDALIYIIPSFKERFKREFLVSDKGLDSENKELSVNLFKGLRNLFIEISRQNGFFLYFDDIQWLDKATFELLNYFVEWESGRKLLMCGSLCEEGLNNMDSPCMDFLSRLKKTANFFVIEMPHFSLEQARDLVFNIFPDIKVKNDFFESIYSLSKGNPLFIEELLKYLIESEKIFYKDKNWQMYPLESVDIPASLDDVIKRRIKGLDVETKEMLVQAALIGEDFHLEILRRVVEKNEGYLLELIDRAKQRVMIGETGAAKGFNFLNSHLQKVFYDELSPIQKSSLHNKAGSVISEFYANNPSTAGDLLYHYNMADNKSKLKEYNQVLSKNSLELFNPQQLSEYLEILSKEVSSQAGPNTVEAQITQIDKELGQEALVHAGELIKCIFAAVRNIRLYPPMNRIREESVKRVYEELAQMLKKTQNLTLSEVEKILLVNGKRIPLKAEKKAVVGDFVSLMIALEIKSLQILSSFEEKELVEFLNVLAEEPDEVRKKGGILVLLKEKGINNIKINMADYSQMTMQSTRQPVKEKLISLVLTDFLTGRTPSSQVEKSAVLKLMQSAPDELAENIVNSAGKASSKVEKAKIIAESIGNLGKQILPGGWAGYKDDLVKLLKNLNAQTRNEVVLFAQDSTDQRMNIIKEVVAKFSYDEMIEMITSGYSKDKASLLNMRELVNKLVFDEDRKKQIMPKLEQELKKMGLEESEISFVVQKEYKSQSLENRMQSLFNLPVALYSNVGIDDVKILIQDLTTLPKKDNLNKLISHFLTQLESAQVQDRAVLFDLIAFSLSLFSCDSDEFDELFSKIVEVYAGYVEKESYRDDFDLLLKGIQLCINWVISSTKSTLSVKRWLIRGRVICLNRLLESLFKFAASKDEEGLSPEVKEPKTLVINILQPPFVLEIVDILIAELKDTSLDYIKMIEDMIMRFGRPALRVLIVSSLEDGKMFSPFDGYIYQRKIINIFKKMEEAAIEELISYLSKESDVKKIVILIRFTAEFKSDKIVDSLKLFLTHQDYKLKEELILALAQIGTRKSKILLTRMKNDKNRRISRLAVSELKKFK